MARRRRLTDGAGSGAAVAARAPAPIAQLAGDAAASAALDDLAQQVAQARAEGRFAQDVPLEAIAEDYLVRDRLVVAADALDALEASLLARGQQVPVEVVALEAGRYGLISGWRRVTALRRLHARTGEARFATVLAVQRQPSHAAEAYLAMVEENEIRAGLSYYERGRIVARAVEQGAFATSKAALQGLFANASRARRSKIGAFLQIYHALDAHLRFPAAIGERLGLSLARAVEGQAGRVPDLVSALQAASPADAAAEAAVLQRWLAGDALSPGAEAGASVESTSGADLPPAAAPAPAQMSEALSVSPRPSPAPGIGVQEGAFQSQPCVILHGAGVDAAFVARLRAFLATDART